MGSTLMSRKIKSGYGLHRTTAREVAARVGVSETSARSWASGEFEPTGERLFDLSRLLGVSPDIFSKLTSEVEAIQQLAAAYETAPIRQPLTRGPDGSVDELAKRRSTPA